MKIGHEAAILSPVSLATPADVTSSANGTGVDVSAYTGQLLLTLHSAAGSGTDPTLDVKLQDSPDNSTFTDVTGATFTQVTDAGATIESIVVEKDKVSRYVRAVLTIGGSSSPTFDCGVTLHARAASN
tara:strand:+ start:4513 stop:4896 length:384 start_codon:yes stop_codon:yes gene_type:complete